MSEKQLMTLVFVLIAAGAWINYAEHPTAKNLKRAIIDTLEL